MQYRSRLKNKLRNALYKNTVVSIGFIVVIIAIVIFFGLQLLINFSLLLGRVKSIGEIPSASENEFVLPPILSPLPEATNSATVEISGLGSQPGQTVEIFLNDEYKTKALVDSNAQFLIPQLRLALGENRIKARAKYGSQESSFSDEISVIYEITPPALEIQEPFDGQVINKTAQTRVVGKTEPETSIYINEFLPIVDGNGSFSYTMPLKEGENVIKIVARDKAGNQTTNEIKVTFVP